MGVVQGRCVVGTVASHCHHLAVLLEELHETLLVCWTGARHHADVLHAVVGFLIAQCGKVAAGDVPTEFFGLGGVFLRPDADLPGYLDGCG